MSLTRILRCSDAYEALRKVYRAKFELDRFLIMQLYEYEPILQVHRAAEEMPHSRSGERLRSVLKRSSCALESSFEEETASNTDCRVLQEHRNIDDTRRPLMDAGMETMVE